MLDTINVRPSVDEAWAAVRRIPEGNDFLAPDELARLEPQEVIRRTTALAPLAAEHAREAERLRRPVEAVWSAIRASGFFYQFVPKAFGGLGGTLDDFIDAALPIAAACPSTAWSACFCAEHNRTLAHFPAQTQAAVWSGGFPYLVAPMLGLPPGRAVRVDGGHRITGHWSWASGIMDADWAFAVSLPEGSSSPADMILALVPAAETEVVDNWHVDGLSGSGSNDVRITDTFVPDARTISIAGLLGGATAEAARHPEPIFRAPIIAFAAFVASVPILGAAKGALALFQEALTRRVEKGTNAKSIENPVKHMRLGQAGVMIDAAETLIRDVGRRVLAAADLTGPEQIRHRVEIRASLAYAVRLCRTAVLDLSAAAGSTAHRLEQPFQRYVRDINVMASHVGYDTDQADEQYGRIRLGLEPTSMLV